VSRKLALAATLNQETGGRSDGAALVQRYVLSGRRDMLGDRLRWLNDELLLAGQAQDAYPLLFYVRPQEAHASFVRALAVTQGIVCTLRYLLDRQEYPEVVDDSQLVMLEECLLYTLHRLERSSHLNVGKLDAARQAPRVMVELHSAVAALHDVGARSIGLEASPRWADAERFRAVTDPYIHAYAAHVDYAPDEIWTTYNRRDRDSAPTEPARAA
jgi:hypothetical protein